MEKYLNADPETGKQFYLDFVSKGKIVMLNLLKYKEVADYSNQTHLNNSEEISGEQAYRLYMEHTLPYLEKAGSRILFFGDAGNFLIGPTNESWDAALLVEHVSVEQFVAFSQNEEYLKIAGHRSAALDDSRLLPITAAASHFSEST